MTSKFSIDNRELLQRISSGEAVVGIDFGNLIVRELAAFRLAAMDSEPDRNPVLAYADSYRDMAKQGVESVPIWSVITDLERNIAPLYRHAQPVTVVPDKMTAIVKDEAEYVEGWNACRAAMLAAAPHDTPALNSIQSVDTVADRWIPVSERMPESNGVYFGWDGKRVLEVNCFFGGFSANQFIHGEITHWMPLPAAPQEVNHG
ncbi:DUF551 domain-containing protein [Klebsiella pneumoniae]|uniref:DUF551 domain-containing protein n=1 Tax=Klebsiella pneumoniae TaxID=573 RepID=UPI0038D23A8E